MARWHHNNKIKKIKIISHCHLSSCSGFLGSNAYAKYRGIQGVLSSYSLPPPAGPVTTLQLWVRSPFLYTNFNTEPHTYSTQRSAVDESRKHSRTQPSTVKPLEPKTVYMVMMEYDPEYDRLRADGYCWSSLTLLPCKWMLVTFMKIQGLQIVLKSLIIRQCRLIKLTFKKITIVYLMLHTVSQI